MINICPDPNVSKKSFSQRIEKRQFDLARIFDKIGQFFCEEIVDDLVTDGLMSSSQFLTVYCCDRYLFSNKPENLLSPLIFVLLTEIYSII